MEWYQSNRNKYALVNKAERSWISEEHFDITQGDIEHKVFLAGFCFSVGLVLPPFLIFWSSNKNPVAFYVGSM